MADRINRSTPALWLFGCAAAATGVINLAFGDFEHAHQPIQAFGDHIPGRIIYAYIVAVCLVAAGAGILWNRTKRAAAALLVVIHLIFAVFSLPRLVTAPAVLGYHLAVYAGVLVSVCQQLILMAAAIIIYANATKQVYKKSLPLIARMIFGVSLLDFGLAHISAVDAAASFVPQWLPPGAPFWVVFTGICFLLAGLSVITGFMKVTASRLTGLMLLLFSILVLMPMLFGSLHDQVAWGSNAYNLEAVGAAWIFAGWFAHGERRRRFDFN